jgi:opacity protein-like surface antigen
MRWVICALAALALPPCAFAGDYDTLRGSEQPVAPAPFTRWAGFYAGGQFGFGDTKASFGNATQAPIAYVLRQTTLESQLSPSAWPVLGTATNGTQNYGGFVGYNSQWQDLVLGLEANFTHTTVAINAPSYPISRITSDSFGNSYLVNINGNGSLSNLDFATLRARAGWVLDNVMPYGFVGFALGRTDLNVSANISGLESLAPNSAACLQTGAAPCIPFAFSASVAKNSDLLYGFDIGAGIDWAITQNIFLRGEWEYVQFAPVEGVLVAVSSARVGGGLKF